MYYLCNFKVYRCHFRKEGGVIEKICTSTAHLEIKNSYLSHFLDNLKKILWLWIFNRLTFRLFNSFNNETIYAFKSRYALVRKIIVL